MPSTPQTSRRAIQLMLFRPARQELNWETLPPEVQQQVLHLLARLLRGQVAQRHGAGVWQEDRDE
jgi:hypothetical protein